MDPNTVSFDESSSTTVSQSHDLASTNPSQSDQEMADGSPNTSQSHSASSDEHDPEVEAKFSSPGARLMPPPNLDTSTGKRYGESTPERSPIREVQHSAGHRVTMQDSDSNSPHRRRNSLKRTSSGELKPASPSTFVGSPDLREQSKDVPGDVVASTKGHARKTSEVSLLSSPLEAVMRKERFAAVWLGSSTYLFIAFRTPPEHSCLRHDQSPEWLARSGSY